MKKRIYLCLLIALCQLGLWAQPVASFTVDNSSICLGESVQFTNTSSGNGLTYAWEFMDGVTSTQANPSHLYDTVFVFGVCLTVTDDMGMMDTLCQEGLITVLPVSENMLSATLCAGEFLLVNGNVYGEVNPTGTEVLTAYNGCDSIITINITFKPVNMSTISEVLCAGQIIYVNGNGYDEANPSGTEVLVGADYNGCDSIIVIDLTFVPVGELAVAYEANIDPCTGSGFNLCITEISCGVPPYSFLWNDGSTDECQNDLNSWPFTVTITDANGASAVINQFSLEQPTILTILGMPTDASCGGTGDGAIDLIVIGGQTPYQYAWSNGATTQDISGLMAGLYTVTVTDANLCQFVSQTEIVESSAITFDYNIDLEDYVLCYGDTFCIGLMNLAGGTTPYNYQWSDGSTDSVLCLPGGATFSLTITDANGGCSVVSDNNINPSFPQLFISSTISCDGDVLIMVTGGTPPYAYSWFNGNTSPTLDNLADGVYNITITDSNGCTITEDIVVTSNQPVINVLPDTLCAGESITLEFLPGASPNFTYLWTPAENLSNATIANPTAHPLETTTYTVIVTDGNTGCTAEASAIIEVLPDCVWPGDTDTNKVVNNFDLLNIGLAFDSIGPLRPNANILWDGQEAPDWTQAILNGPNYKQIDCDGNGSIGYNDTMAVVNNWGQVHLISGDAEQQFQHDYPIADGLIITAPFYVQPDTLIEGTNMLLPIILGEDANAAEDIYGIAFSLNYDTAFIVETAVSIGFGTSWLGSANNNMITIQKNFPNEGRIDVAMTRIDGVDITDYGQLAAFFITVEDDILFAPGGGSGFMLLVDDAVFSISNVLALNSSGEEIPVIPTETTAPIGTSTSNNTLANHIHIYPNPATARIWVTTKNIQLQQIALYDLNGQLLRSSTTNVLDIQALAAGLYLVKVQTTAGVYVAKVVVN